MKGTILSIRAPTLFIPPTIVIKTTPNIATPVIYLEIPSVSADWTTDNDCKPIEGRSSNAKKSANKVPRIGSLVCFK